MVSMKVPTHVYVHVPFCRAKCRYCGFYSVPHDANLVRLWLDGLARECEWRFTATPIQLESVYLGGGTPSILELREINALCALIRTVVNGYPGTGGGSMEWTAEANPASLDADRAAVLGAAGVNRVSIGAQSFDAATLRWLGRPYTPEAIPAAMARLREAGIVNLGLDLIAGAPRATLAWEAEIRAAAALAPRHLSVYMLSVETGTPLARAVRRERYRPLSATAENAILDRTEDLLAALGYAQYEISNYARPGGACRHNLNTWRGGDYLGLGPAAASRIGRWRWTNPANLEAWHRTVTTRTPPPGYEQLRPEADAIERILFQTRLNEGLRDDFALLRTQHPAPSPADAWPRRLRELANQGLAEWSAGRWRLTRAGRRRADSIAEALLP
jgi:oxygen-independent coproporphyrinogen III oxidase